MKLHEDIKEFNTLITIVAKYKNIPEAAIKRDYLIVYLLNNLEKSKYREKCVFKGGTSLSKCYPNSIERFSEDIDLTYLGMDEVDKSCDKQLKEIEQIISSNANIEKITNERNNRNKSSYIWVESKENRIKLEIGCSIKPDPYSKKKIKTYIKEYLEENGFIDEIIKYELKEVELNVLNIERTFIDKVMAVKRHAICGKLNEKVRHIYDVVKLYEMNEIKDFLQNTNELNNIIKITKKTDAFYFEKRNLCIKYNSLDAYNFDDWKDKFDDTIRENYNTLSDKLLYTNEKQDLNKAIEVFQEINEIFKSLNQ